MSPTIAMQSAIVERLRPSEMLTGVYFDPPARAGFPYAVLNCNNEKDWSCKDRAAREIALELMLWDVQPSRLLLLEKAVEDSLDQLSVSSGWHLSTLVLTGKRRIRDPGGPWSCTLEYRARLIEQRTGEAA